MVGRNLLLVLVLLLLKFGFDCHHLYIFPSSLALSLSLLVILPSLNISCYGKLGDEALSIPQLLGNSLGMKSCRFNGFDVVSTGQLEHPPDLVEFAIQNAVDIGHDIFDVMRHIIYDSASFFVELVDVGERLGTFRNNVATFKFHLLLFFDLLAIIHDMIFYCAFILN
jgi:hypothetical protein